MAKKKLGVGLLSATEDPPAWTKGKKYGRRGASVMYSNITVHLFEGEFPQGEIVFGDVRYERGLRGVSVTVGDVTSKRMLEVPEPLPLELFLDGFRQGVSERRQLQADGLPVH